MPIFSEHITETGSADYYVSGEEPDDLIKSLIMCGFSYRKQLIEAYSIIHIGGSIGKIKSIILPSESSIIYIPDTIVNDLEGYVNW